MIGNSKQSAREAHLRYVTDDRPGYSRKRSGSGFHYITAEGTRVKKADCARIDALAIPPAWEDVWICPYADGHVQATGRDAKGRKQSRYHEQWHAVRTQTNFHRMIAFAKALPKIRRRVARDLRRKGLPREKVLAAVVSLMEQTNIRIGNEEYAKENQSFGLTTMRDRHVEVRGDRIQFNFRGKSGKFHEVDLTDPKLARIVKRCQDLPGYDLFQYHDENGEVCDLTSEQVNAYLREIAGDEFTAKDFRTWAGTVCAADELRRQLRVDGKKKPTQKTFLKVCDTVAAALGNTRAVCRKHYIHPAVSSSYLDGTFSKWIDAAPTAGSPRGLRVEEVGVVRLLKNCVPS